MRKNKYIEETKFKRRNTFLTQSGVLVTKIKKLRKHICYIYLDLEFLTCHES